MTHETDDFAAWRFARRTGDSPARNAYAIERFGRPARLTGERVYSVLLAAVLGALLAISLIHWWSTP